MSLLDVPPASSCFPLPHRFTTRQMAVIWEVLRWAHFIALLMHSHKQPTPLLSFSPFLLFLVDRPLFALVRVCRSALFSLPVCHLPPDQSFLLRLCLPASFPVFIFRRTNVPTHAGTLIANRLSLESNSGTLKHLRSPLFFAILIMQIILPLPANCTKWQLLVSNPVLGCAPERQPGNERVGSQNINVHVSAVFGRPDPPAYHPTYYLDVPISRTASAHSPSSLPFLLPSRSPLSRSLAHFFLPPSSPVMIARQTYICIMPIKWALEMRKERRREGEWMLHNAWRTSVSPIKRHLSKTTYARGHKLGAISDRRK